MHILSHRQVQRIAGLISIHDMLIMLQTGRVTLCVVEREVDIVGIVGEDIIEVILQGVGQLDIRFRIQLGPQLSGHVRHERQLIVELRLLRRLHAVAQILIDHRTAWQDDRHGHPADYLQYVEPNILHFLLSNGYIIRQTSFPSQINRNTEQHLS